ncbi:MAG: hypothetical protein QOC63_5114 [Mycobacterium sp.]|jgi:hypothetical protein|nr:hypothetical protein [Mycobacterium sp.]
MSTDTPLIHNLSSVQNYAPTDHSGGAKNSKAMPSGSRKLRPDP